MRILIANDDGIHSTGIKYLAESLAKDHEVYVIAPDRERSAAGHSLTLHHPLRIEKIKFGEDSGITAWETTGTPGDCVKLGIKAVLKDKPDIVIAGINHGPNLGADVLYSGTVSAAMEGAVLGYPSIAVSLFGGESPAADFSYPAEFIRRFVNRIVKINFPKKTILNINLPAVGETEIAGIEITRLGTRMYTDKYEKRLDPRGKTYYWLAGEIMQKHEEAGTDIAAIRNNKISITPVTFEMTHTSIMSELELAFCDGKCEPWL